MTTVVNIYKDDYDVYIGRAGRGNGGYFGNPVAMTDNSESERQRVLEEYKTYFDKRMATDPEFNRRILELKDKRLGCFCAPKGCHGNIIADFLDNKP